MIIKDINDWIVVSFALTGTLFLCYFFVVFIQKKIKNILRLGISALFLFTGLFFMNEAGKILTDYDYKFSFMTIVSSMTLALSGFIVVYVIHPKHPTNKEQ